MHNLSFACLALSGILTIVRDYIKEKNGGAKTTINHVLTGISAILLLAAAILYFI